MNVQFFEEKPLGFVPAVKVSGCCCESEGRTLFLRRAKNTDYGGTWCYPAGKLNEGESPLVGARREVFEETHISLPKKLVHLGTLFCLVADFAYTFDVFWKKFEVKPSIILNKKEHTEFRWVTMEEALELDLIPGGKEVLDFCKKKSSTSVEL